MEINIIFNCVINNLLFRKEKKTRFISYQYIVLEFSTYLPIYLTCPNLLCYRLYSNNVEKSGKNPQSAEEIKINTRSIVKIAIKFSPCNSNFHYMILLL